MQHQMTLIGRIVHALQSAGDSPSLLSGPGTWSAADLLAHSARIAGSLRAAGVQAGTPVAVLLPRGAPLVLTLLAVHRLGACCVPLDFDAPSTRLQHCIAQSGARLLVSDLAALRAADTDFAAQLQTSLQLLDAATLTGGDPIDGWVDVAQDAPFCILFTSGSTGAPKGVQLSQLNVLNCLAWMQHQYPLGCADAMLFKTPVGFDVSMYELFWPLMAGARVVAADEDGYKDAAHLVDCIRRHGVTAAHFVPAMLAAFSEEADVAQCTRLSRLFAAGEALPWALVERLRRRLPSLRVSNLYGPTEGGVVSYHDCQGRDGEARYVPIGRAVHNTQLWVLDDAQQALPAGSEGELYIGGAQVALGYIGQPQLTAERFVQHPQYGRLYRTGDFVIQQADGVLEYRGRRDQQVKLRGVRVELGEIEAALLAHPAIRNAAADVRDVHGQPALLAWYSAAAPLDSATLRSFLEQRLTAAMLPQHLLALEALPQLVNGKIDRRALPLPVARGSVAAPATELQRRLLSLWQEVLGPVAIGVDDRFFEIGGSSLQAVALLGRLRAQLQRRVPLARFFEAASIRGLATLLEADFAMETGRWLHGALADITAPAARAQARPARAAAAGDQPIAIVGMACRVPGAPDLDAFWDLVASGREGLRDFTDAELLEAGVDPALSGEPGYVRRGGVIDEPYGFDAGFFGYTPREAELTDPQQRLLLECAWHALEDAGIRAYDGARVAVYAGLARNQYFDRQLASYAELRRGDDGFQTLLGNDKDYAATRVAYKLDLRGPALTLQTACSSSGVAVHLAAQALRNGDCEAALVGGVRLNLPHHAGYAHLDGGPQAADGRVRPFDAQASGMVLTSGVACLVLKPLARALADGDRVYATLTGSAVNNDGADKVGYTAPSLRGQAEVIESALAAAGVDAASVGYIEAHGTGTLLGDPIEVAALARGYASAERIALGSVKGNIGHLDAAAGAIGIVKAALALWHRQLPPSIHYDTANPECDFEHTPFFVNTRLADWPSDGPRRAAVSSFGFGGTNFHGLLQEAPVAAASSAAARPAVLRLSAATPTALEAQARQLAARLGAGPDVSLADVAYTLDLGRTRLPHRAAVVAGDAADAIAQLGAGLRAATPASAPSLVFMFPGQGAQHVDMGRELYESEPLFRQIIDTCAARLKDELAVDLIAVLYPQPAQHERAVQLMATTEYAQPAIFAVSYALARLWQSLGYAPQACIGHSVGEFVAATLAGVFTLDDALGLIADRGRMMQSQPTGGMLAVRLPEAQIAAYLEADVALAATNSPQQVVVAGPEAALDRVAQRLREAGVACARLATSHAFHSPMMDGIVPLFAERVSRTPRGESTLALASTLTGDWASPGELANPEHWARQLREPVRFGDALQVLLATPGRVLLEVGPGQNLSTAVKQALQSEHAATVIASLPHANQTLDARRHWLDAVGRLFVAGIEHQPAAFYAGETRTRLGLPGYPFEHRRYSIDAAVESAATQRAVAALPAAANDAAAVAATAAVDPAIGRLLPLMEGLTGDRYTEDQFDRSFLELGMDSLTLTQLAGQIKSRLKIAVRFRSLLEELGSIRRLGEHLRASIGEAPSDVGSVVPIVSSMLPAPATPPAAPATFGAGARIRREGTGLSVRQQLAVDELTTRYLTRTWRSREFAAGHRDVLADPRTVSGFRPEIKELVYPIVVDRSEGAHLWDLDGNQYVDATCGFGSMFFGHRAGFVTDAIEQQLHTGWEIGPQTPLAGECARLFTQATGLARVAFCNTGSEAVIAAVRLARTVSGRPIIVSFEGDYHGIQDEVIVRGVGGRSMPAAPGIPPESVANTLILEYGSPDSLRVIRERADEIAGILIEPVQSRRPDLQPREFLHQLRALTRELDIAFMMDEVITGFRAGLRGAQGFYGVEADIGIYGKVFGGGMPVGAVAGIPKYLDALDGGAWQYGDASVPEAGVTYFAGTFVRHPLTMAAVRASLRQLLAHPEWPEQVTAKAERLVERINADCVAAGVPMHVVRFASLWKAKWDCDQRHGDLLFMYLRERGIHIWDGRPCFVSVAHDQADCDRIVEAFRYAFEQMKDGDLIDYADGSAPAREALPDAPAGPRPPVPQARIGRDAVGNPAWFVEDADRPGHYLIVEKVA